MSDREFPVRPFVGASLAIFRNGKVLLARRGAASGFGLFSLPGGLVELGESAEAAALREAKEEVGVSAGIVGLAGHADVIEKTSAGIRQHYVVLTFAGIWLAGEARTSPEATEIIWAGLSDVHGLPMTRGLPEILRKSAAMVQSGVK